MTDITWRRLDLLEEDAPEGMSAKEQMLKAFGFRFQVERIIRKYWWLVVASLVMGSLLATMYAVGFHNGKSVATEKVTEQLTAEYNKRMQDYIDQQQAKTLVTGEASKNAAIQNDAKYLARIGQGVLNTYASADLEDAEKLMLCAVCRVLSGGQFAKIKSIEAAATQEQQWWGYSDGLTCTEDVYQKAVEVATMYENGEPMPCATDMTFAGWNGHEIVLRNQWEANANARYY